MVVLINILLTLSPAAIGGNDFKIDAVIWTATTVFGRRQSSLILKAFINESIDLHVSLCSELLVTGSTDITVL